MTAATAESPTRPGWVPVPERMANHANRPPVATPARLGPLLAVCGLAGGAGVTTLSYLVALAAVRQSADPVLVADTGGPSGGLAACAGVEVERSLSEVAGALSAGVALGGGIYATGQDGLRVLATGPEFFSRPADHQLERLLAHAREAHGLTVIDCGTLARAAEQTAAAAATHLAWVLTATADGVRRGLRVLEAAPPMAGKELVVARNDVRQANAPLRQLRQIAAERRAPLVLVPHLAGLDARRLDACAEAAQIPVQAILGALRR
jgi:MinD-like ATPase involved in chromosome partitioning or flagellar assembly